MCSTALMCCFFVIRERKLITVSLKSLFIWHLNQIHLKSASQRGTKNGKQESNKTCGRSRFVFVGSTSNYPPLLQYA